VLLLLCQVHSADVSVREDWWHQLCHSWTHYAFVVPFIWLLNWNSKHTTYAAAWTLVNAHEVAVISGQVSQMSFCYCYRCRICFQLVARNTHTNADIQAAAYKLGASYPKELYENDFAKLCFRLYLLLAHGTILRKSRTA
jgi:hypothetical protein